MATSIDVLRSNFLKYGRWEIGEIVHSLLDKKTFAWLSSCRYCVDRAKHLPGPAPTMYSEWSRFHPNRFAFGRAIAEHVNTAKMRRKVNPIFSAEA